MVNVSNILLKRLSCDVEQPIEVCLEIALFSPGPKTPVNARNTSLDSKNPGSNRADTRLRESAQRCEVRGVNTSRTLGGFCTLSSLRLLAINESMVSIRLSLIIYPVGKNQTARSSRTGLTTEIIFNSIDDALLRECCRSGRFLTILRSCNICVIRVTIGVDDLAGAWGSQAMNCRGLSRGSEGQGGSTR